MEGRTKRALDEGAVPRCRPGRVLISATRATLWRSYMIGGATPNACSVAASQEHFLFLFGPRLVVTVEVGHALLYPARSVRAAGRWARQEGSSATWRGGSGRASPSPTLCLFSKSRSPPPLHHPTPHGPHVAAHVAALPFFIALKAKVSQRDDDGSRGLPGIYSGGGSTMGADLGAARSSAGQRQGKATETNLFSNKESWAALPLVSEAASASQPSASQPAARQ